MAPPHRPGLYCGLILKKDRFHRPPTFIHIPLDPAAQPDVSVGINEYFDVHQVPQGFILENQNTLYHDYTFGLQQDYLIAPVMNGKIIYRALYGMPCPEFLQVSDHQLCFKSRWFVVIELAPLLIGKIVVGPVVVVVCLQDQLRRCQPEGSNARCRVLAGGDLSDRKSVNFPNRVLAHDFLSQQDQEDLLFGIRNGVDFVAASFVSNRRDMEDLRTFLDENGGSDIDIIAKIENRSGVDHIEEICQVADGVMVARGDLGVEIPFVEVPAIQKYLINKCRLLGKRVITATEMLESMIHNPRPTRAEISDVANAVYDGASAVMLSGETAAGKYPVAAVKNMAEIAEYTEKHISYIHRFHTTEFEIHSNLDAVSHATCAMAIDVGAKCIVVSSMSGRTARMVSRFRCPADIVGMTTTERAWRKLALSWGVTPVLSEEFNSMDVMFYHALSR